MRSGMHENAISFDIFSEKSEQEHKRIHYEWKENWATIECDWSERRKSKETIENSGLLKTYKVLNSVHGFSIDWFSVFEHSAEKFRTVTDFQYFFFVDFDWFTIDGIDSIPFPFVRCPQNSSLAMILSVPLHVAGQMLIINSRNYERFIEPNGVACWIVATPIRANQDIQ